MRININLMKEKILRKGFNLKAMAFEADMSEKYLRKILMGKKAKVRTVARLANILRINFSELAE